jgi:acetate kinase
MRILCFDVGSSSLKLALYDWNDGAATLVSAENVGTENAEHAVSTHLGGREPDGIGHRIVFGGRQYDRPVIVDDRVMADLASFVAFDALHMEPQTRVIRQLRGVYPGVPQVACFDTSFYRALPEIARRFPLPTSVGDGVRRYGFHGLSYEYLVSALEDARRGKVVMAHLGSGASMCALRDGKPADTTMGMTPLGGLMMGTRPGDLDPGILVYLVERGLNAGELSDLLYRKSGLLGVSETSSDVRELAGRSASDARAAFALDLFVYQARKQLGAMIAALGGLDTLVFTAGIGEGSPDIRGRICDAFAFMGIEIDRSRNAVSAAVISSEASSVCVRVVQTNENLMIARHVAETLQGTSH